LKKGDFSSIYIIIFGNINNIRWILPSHTYITFQKITFHNLKSPAAPAPGLLLLGHTHRWRQTCEAHAVALHGVHHGVSAHGHVHGLIDAASHLSGDDIQTIAFNRNEVPLQLHPLWINLLKFGKFWPWKKLMELNFITLLKLLNWVYEWNWTNPGPSSSSLQHSEAPSRPVPS